MSFAYAFKNSAEAAKRETGMAAIFSAEIGRVTGGKFSHVECWIDGPQNAAICFSSREPHGTSIDTIDLTDATLWTIVPVKTTPEQDLMIRGFALGSSGRPYDMLGIIGIGSGDGIHADVDRFCSEVAFELGSLVLSQFPKTISRWMVAPSGPTKNGRYGLYELLTGASNAK